MSGLPSIAECRAVLADGSSVTVTATRRAREGRADVKCSVPGQHGVALRMQQVVRLARHTELRFDSREQVMLSVDRPVGEGDRGWELAAVLADRMVRGLLPLKTGLAANGWSDEWHLGRINGHTLRTANGDVLLGGADGLAHLGALTGRPDLSGAVSSARAWFPLHSAGAADSLCWVEVSVFPLEAADIDEEAAISVPGQDAAVQHAVRRALVDARHFDGRPGAAWRTTVRFAETRFQGNSFELALVMADRMARGREFLPRGRIIATGCSVAWHAGRVEAVEAIGPKCMLILREAAAGDRVLLPRACEAQVPAGFAGQLRERGASLACVERIGIL